MEHAQGAVLVSHAQRRRSFQYLRGVIWVDLQGQTLKGQVRFVVGARGAGKRSLTGLPTRKGMVEHENCKAI